MSRRSGAAALAVTITVTVAVTVMTIALNPSRGDSYSSQVLENARKRQSYSIAAIPEHLETDIEVLREEDIMAQKVSEILLADSSFMNTVGDRSAEYVGEKISDLEEQYASNTISRIDASLSSSRNYTDSAVAELSSSLSREIEAVSAEVEGTSGKVDGLSSAIALESGRIASLQGQVTDLEGSLETVKGEAEDAKAAIPGKDEVLSYILEDEAFLETLANEISRRTGSEISTDELIDAVLSSAAFSNEVTALMESYHSAVAEKTSSSIPIPVFDVAPEREYSEEEYLEERNRERGDEIDKILSFLGY